MQASTVPSCVSAATGCSRAAAHGRHSCLRSDSGPQPAGIYIGDDSEQVASYKEELADAELAQKLYDLRTKAGLNRGPLVKLVGTTASMIWRLEDADYEGYSVAMLRRITAALEKRVEIRFLTARRHLKAF
jgi:hypothetical protein